MKKTARLLSMLLSLILLLSLAAVSASADDGPFGENDLTVSAIFLPDPSEETTDSKEFSSEETLYDEDTTDSSEEESGEALRGAKKAEPELACKVYLVDHSEGSYEEPQPVTSIPLQKLIAPDMELMIVPPEEWYVSGLGLTGGDQSGQVNDELMKKMHADPNSTAVSLFFYELRDLDYPDRLDTTYYPSGSSGYGYKLEITCSKLPEDSITITYSSPGTFDQYKLMNDDSDDNQDTAKAGGWYTIPEIRDEVFDLAKEWNLDFKGILMTYESGAQAEVEPGDKVFIYSDTRMELQWEKGEEESEIQTGDGSETGNGGNEPGTGGNEPGTGGNEPGAGDENKVGPGSETKDDKKDESKGESESKTDVTIWEIPAFTVTANSASKQYDGSPLTDSGYTTSIDLSNYGNWTLDVTVQGSITEPSDTPAANVITSCALYDPDGNPVEGKVNLQNGTLTVTKRKATVTAISGTIITHGEKVSASTLDMKGQGFEHGWKAENLLEGHTLTGDFVTGSDTVSFDTGIDTKKVQVVTDDSNHWDVSKYYEITGVGGHIEINNVASGEKKETTPTSTNLSITTKSQTWTYDGQPHTAYEYSSNGLIDGDRIVRVTFDPKSEITDVGTTFNWVTGVDITDSSGGKVPSSKYQLNQNPGILTIVKRDLYITGISGSLTTQGGEIVASTLKSPDGVYSSGYKAEGLVPGHSVSGSFVEGSGTTSFQTVINPARVTVLDERGHDVTSNYNIIGTNGYITITVSNPQKSQVNLVITAKDGSFTYDGQEHSQNEYTAVGLVDGDQIEKVTFKPTSVITNAGTQVNEIQSVVIKSASGAAVDNSKYSIKYVPGKLTVTKFPLTLTAVSDEKVYDGKALNNKNVKSSALAASNHKLSADYEVYDKNGNSIKNGPVDVGVYTKKVGNVKITAGSQDVTQNYDITTIDGTLTIRDAAGKTNPDAVTNTAYYGSTYTIRSSAPYSEFQYLMIDGQKISGENFTVREGSTIITLKASFIQSLKTGNHNYTIVSTSQRADGTFNVAKAPKTADKSKSLIFIVLIVVALLLALAAWISLRRRPKKKPSNPQPPQNGRKTAGTAAKPAAQSARTGARSNGNAPTRSGKSNSVMGSGKVTPSKKKPVSDVVMDFGTVLGEEPEDPTNDLVKDFRINLDDYRAPEQAREMGLKRETNGNRNGTGTAERSGDRSLRERTVETGTGTAEQSGDRSLREKAEEVKQPPIRKQAAFSEVQETAPKAAEAFPKTAEAYASRFSTGASPVPGASADGTETTAPASWYQAVQPKDDEEPYRPKH